MRNRRMLKVCVPVLLGTLLYLYPGSAKVCANPAASTEYGQIDLRVPAVTGWSLEDYSDSQYATWTNRLTSDQELYIEWSQWADFTKETDYVMTNAASGEYCLSKHFQKGRTYYVRAYVAEKVRVSDRRGGWNEEVRYGPYSQTLTVTQKAADVSVREFHVDQDSVTIRLESEETVTGYDIHRAEENGKYKRIAKTSDNVYTDTGLNEAHTYRYRIRSFVFDPKTRLTAYGDWEYCRATIWGQELQVRALPAAGESIKVKWKKVPGADGYRIYRVAGVSRSETIIKGKKSSFRSCQLMKDFTKASARSFQDKKVEAGESYTYIVVAYKNIRQKNKAAITYVMQGSDSVSLKFARFEADTTRRRADESVRVTWKKRYDVDGYLVRKLDPVTGKYEKYGYLSENATGCTCPKASGGKQDQYLIYAYRGKCFSKGIPVTTTCYPVGRPEQIRAYATADGQSIQVSWNYVPGASYYKVYRSRYLSAYDGDLDSYDFRGAETVKVWNAARNGAEEEIFVTNVADQQIRMTVPETGETKILNEGPAQGLVYYYYVQAYRSNGEKIEGSMLYSRPARVILNMPFSRPMIASLKSSSAGKAAVNWSEVPGAVRYELYCSTRKTEGYELVRKTANTGVTVKNLTSGKKYYFRVRAYRPNAVGADLYSESSPAKSVIIK